MITGSLSSDQDTADMIALFVSGFDLKAQSPIGRKWVRPLEPAGSEVHPVIRRAGCTDTLLGI
jgi:hypothetical protein